MKHAFDRFVQYLQKNYYLPLFFSCLGFAFHRSYFFILPPFLQAVGYSPNLSNNRTLYSRILAFEPA